MINIISANNLTNMHKKKSKAISCKIVSICFVCKKYCNQTLYQFLLSLYNLVKNILTL